MSVGNGDFETPGAGAGEALLWSYDGNCPTTMYDQEFCGGLPSPPEVRHIRAITDTQNITVNGDVFSNPYGALYHAVLAAYRDDGSLVWSVHIRGATAGQNYCYPTQSPVVVDRLGNAYVVMTGQSSSGIAEDMVWEINFGTVNTAPQQTFTTRKFGTSTGSLQQWLLKITQAGAIEWASRGFTSPDATAYQGQHKIEALTLLDQATLGVVVGVENYGAYTVGGIVLATFFPETDGAYSDSYYEGGATWFCELNTTNGKLKAQPGRLAPDQNAGASYYPDYVASRTPQVVTPDGRLVVAVNAGYPNWSPPSYKGRIYRAGSQTTDEPTGDAPSPGYPTNMRWETNPEIGGDSVATYMLALESGTRNPRYAISAHIAPWDGANPQDNYVRMEGAASVPGTEDVLFSVSHRQNHNSHNTRLHIESDRQEQGSWQYDSLVEMKKYGADLVRLDDNPGAPEAPTVAWVARYEHNIENANNGNLNHFMTPPVCDPASDAFVVVGRAVRKNGDTKVVEWGRVEPTRIAAPIVDPNAANNQPTTTSIMIFAGHYSDGTPTWVQAVEVGTTDSTSSQVMAAPVRRGREWAIPMVGGLKFVFDPLGPFELSETFAGKKHVVAYYDITSGEFKRRDVFHAQDSDNELTPAWLLSGYTDVRDDLPDEPAIIGTPFTSTAPVVENLVGGETLSFTNEGDSLGGTGLSMNSSTGAIEGTATSGGLFEIITRVDSSEGTYSRSNRWRLTVTAAAVTMGDYPDILSHVFDTAITPFTPTGTGTYFKVVAGQLPDGIVLNSSTGELSGTPTEAALLDYVHGDHTGIVIEANATVQSTPFRIQVVGVTLPTPTLYIPGDGDADEDISPISATLDAGTLAYATGTSGQAIDFDGATGTSYGVAMSVTTGGFTIAMNVSNDNLQSTLTNLVQTINGANNRYIWIETGVFNMSGAGGTIGVTMPSQRINPGGFRSIICTRGGGFIGANVDGVEAVPVADSAGDLELVASGAVMRLAGGYFYPRFNGRMDEFAFWNGVVLDADQKTTLRWLKNAGISMKTWIGF